MTVSIHLSKIQKIERKKKEKKPKKWGVQSTPWVGNPKLRLRETKTDQYFNSNRGEEMKKRLVFLLPVMLIMLLGQFGSASSQGECDPFMLKIVNESAQQLDEEKVCDAALPFIQKGLKVYLWLTDLKTNSEDDWFNHIDAKESALGLLQSGGFHKASMLFAASTVTENWGRTHDYGELFFGNPYDADKNLRLQIKQRSTGDFLSGRATEGFVKWMNGVYAAAYPPIPPTATPAPVQPTEVRQAPPVSSTTPITSQQQDQGPGFPWGQIVLVAVLLAGGVLIVVYVIVPWQRQQAIIAAKRQKIAEIRAAVDQMTVLVHSMLEGKDFSLSALGGLMGVEQYEKLNERFTGSLQLAREAYDRLERVIAELEASAQQRDLDDQITRWGLVYYSFIGGRRVAQGLSAEQLDQWVSPVGELNLNEIVQSEHPLLAQIVQITADLKARPLYVEIEGIEFSRVEQYGVFGALNEAKSVLLKLDKVNREGPQTVQKAQVARASLVSQSFPQLVDGKGVIAAVDKPLEQAQNAATKKRWLDVVEYAEQTIQLATELIALVPALTTAISAYQQRLKTVDGILQQGFTLPFDHDARVECQHIIDVLNARLSNGEVENAKRSIQNLDDESRKLLEKAQALIDLYGANMKRLQDLSTQVARVEKYRVGIVQPAWDTLQGYPQSNWEGVAYFDEATATLARLFDDPANHKDLASEIQRLNSMEVQDFTGAEVALDQAFADLRMAEQQLHAVLDQVALVQQIEQEIEASLVATDVEIQKASERRTRDDVLIDEVVDGLIKTAQRLLGEARKFAGGREFITAQACMSEARKNAGDAYASAESQVQAIAQLRVKLEQIRVQAQASVRQALDAQAALVPAAQVASTSGMVSSANDALKTAQRSEAGLAKLEDRKLAKALGEVIKAYETANQLAQKASNQIAQDKREYDGWYQKAQGAISSASSQISSAESYVGDSDAGGAGGTSLRQAQGSLPGMLQYGAAVSAYQRLIEQAESAEELAEKAARSAQARIREAEEAREAGRRRQEAAEAAERSRREAERRRQEREDEERREVSRRSSDFASRGGGVSDFGGRGRG